MTVIAVTMLGWAALTILELLLGLRGYLSLGLTGLQTLAVPALTVAVVTNAREELDQPALEEGAPGATRKQAARDQTLRTHWLRTYGVHGVVLLLLAGVLFGKYQVLYRAIGDPASAADLVGSYETYGVASFVVALAGVLGSPRRIAGLVAKVADRPARLMTGSFGLAALIGTLVLALPISLNRVEDASLLNAFFNAVSAVCVTGLAVGNVAETYSFFGQLVLFILFQMGGLGIMSLSTFFAVLGGQRLHARRAKAMAQLLDVNSFAALRKSLLGLVAFTFVVELLGAAWLYMSFGEAEIAMTAAESDGALAGAGSRVWAAVFHAVSAYCNAGFSNFRGGVVPLVSSHGVSLAITLLIVVGGIGFPVVFELLARLRARLQRERPKVLTLHTRVVLVTSGLLTVVGAAAFLVLEGGGAMGHLHWDERIVGALFQSVTCRTAGFSTVDFGAMGPATWMVAGMLMFIGASPGSTGGGAKTTTLAALFATLRAELVGGGGKPSLGGRALTDGTVRRAIAVTFINVVVVGVILFVLLLTESADPARLVFEVVSAVSTAGLSTGITSDLTGVGKVVVTLGMFLGRIGPLTAALVITDKRGDRTVRLVQERIAIG